MEKSLTPILSVIIPTRSRCAMLQDTLQSLIDACTGQENAVECLVIDNGSTDNTRSIVEAFADKAPFIVRYIYEPCPGLHVGRNLGATLAQSEILAYLDDDVLVQPGWAAALLARFNADPANMIVGGPCLPQWEVPPPTWLDSFRTSLSDGGWAISQLSLIYMGDMPKPVSGKYIYGCNFAIRRHFILESGGFHPDGMPSNLLHFRGDGETEMGKKVDAHPEYTAFYDPAVAVLHRVPVSRMTKEYIIKITKRNGIGSAYSMYRVSAGCTRSLLSQWLQLTRKLYKSVKKYIKYRIKNIIQKSITNGSPISLTFLHIIAIWQTYQHYIRICFSPVLRAWVTQLSYLPDAPCPYRKTTSPSKL